MDAWRLRTKAYLSTQIGKTVANPRPSRQGRKVTGGEVPDGFWAMLAVRLLHSCQVQIIEAMRWVDQPLSASELVQVLGTGQRLSTIAYHVRRLDSLGALTPAGERHPMRGSEEKLYRLGFR